MTKRIAFLEFARTLVQHSPGIDKFQTFGDMRQPVIRQRLNLHSQLYPLLSLRRRE